MSKGLKNISNGSETIKKKIKEKIQNNGFDGVDMYKGKRVVLLIPAYNEEGKIGEVLKKVPREFVDETVVVNDGSTDNTEQEIIDNSGTVISFPENKGLGVAFKALFAYAKEKKYDIAVIVGGDDQDDPREIHKFLQWLVDEGYHMVQGSRYLGKTEDMPFIRWMTTKIYSLFFSIVAGRWVTDASTGYKGFQVSLLDKIDLSEHWLEEKYGIEQYFLMQTIKKGYKVKEVPVTKYFPLARGYSKMKLLKDWYKMCQPIVRSISKRQK